MSVGRVMAPVLAAAAAPVIPGAVVLSAPAALDAVVGALLSGELGAPIVSLGPCPGLGEVLGLWSLGLTPLPTSVPMLQADRDPSITTSAVAAKARWRLMARSVTHFREQILIIR